MKKTALFTFVSFVLAGCTRIVIPAGDERIIMQQPVTREVIYCESESGVTDEECAFFMEKEGFVRLTDKSVFAGHDDIPLKGAYPTRRYRDRQDIPRW